MCSTRVEGDLRKAHLAETQEGQVRFLVGTQRPCDGSPSVVGSEVLAEWPSSKATAS